ncbi:MAG: enoyl-CoA hydratase/isomerase family protein [Chloroflexi bacterium]|nr:enoyl-CoA hydratase/isomerase family protein [Chloroflexota bacterium]
MGYHDLILERRGAIAVIRLNRPDKHNALNRRLSEELIDALDRVEADGSVHVVVLTGNGDRAFCAGADMAEAVNSDSGSAAYAPGRAVGRVLRFSKPVIAAVNGYAYGGGASLAINCDIRIAADTAKFRFVGVTYGLVVGASQLPRVVGAPVAKELTFTARVVEAEEALRIGLVNRVVPLAEVEATALEMAKAIADASPLAVQAAKAVIDKATDNTEAVRHEVETDRALRQSDDHRERFRAAAERLTGSGGNGPGK